MASLAFIWDDGQCFKMMKSKFWLKAILHALHAILKQWQNSLQCTNWKMSSKIHTEIIKGVVEYVSIPSVPIPPKNRLFHPIIICFVWILAVAQSYFFCNMIISDSSPVLIFLIDYPVSLRNMSNYGDEIRCQWQFNIDFNIF